MALVVARPINETTVSAYLADVSADTSAFAVATCRGRVVRAYSVIFNAITGADATYTVGINGTAITGMTGTIANSGSAAGDVDVVLPTAQNNYVNEGDHIVFNSGGESSTTCPTMFYAVIERD
jgi:hypothetical protein